VALQADGWLHGCLAVPVALWQAYPHDRFARALTVLAVSEADQHPYVASVAGDRLIAIDEIAATPGPAGLAYVAFNVPLVSTLGLPPVAAAYHVQAGSHQFRSNVLRIEVFDGL
jgi:hypothetical protein